MSSLELSQRESIVRETLCFARNQIPIVGPIVIEWRRYTSTAGKAFSEEGRICLSLNLLNTEERLRETVLHEYAHIYVYRAFGRRVRAHGPEWKGAMLALGADPQVTHKYECEKRTVRKPYVCKCRACGFELRRARPLKPRRVYTHLGCGGVVVHHRTAE